MRLNGAAAAAGGSAARRRLFVTIYCGERTDTILRGSSILPRCATPTISKKRPVCSIQERHGRFKGKVIAWVKRPIRSLFVV